MNTSPRRTRLQGKRALALAQAAATPSLLTNTTTTTSSDSNAIITTTTATPVPTSSSNDNQKQEITPLPAHLTQKQTGLTRKSHTLLQRKQALLRSQNTTAASTSHFPLPPQSQNAIQAALVFAQQSAGTAVCIHSSPAGAWLLTCSHCVAETREEWELELELQRSAGEKGKGKGKGADGVQGGKVHWLLFADGRVVGARCVAWDGRRDLALLRVVTAQVGEELSLENGEGREKNKFIAFPAVAIAESSPKTGAKMVCVGHPGSEDLEADVEGVKTGYDVLHLSEGRYRGCAPGQDVHDNEEIGALMHDCWTYWGHSGAPLLERDTGMLVGLHSSWDDSTGMRRGVALEAIRAFLDEIRGE